MKLENGSKACIQNRNERSRPTRFPYNLDARDRREIVPVPDMPLLSSQPGKDAKESGAYYTPGDVAAALVRWAVREDTDTLLDPSCGDGRFIARHANCVGVERDGDAASVGIGYVSGANEFFHLRPSEAARWRIPEQFLHPTVRNGRVLPARVLSPRTIDEWRRSDQPMLLLRIPREVKPPASVMAYLDSEKGQQARQTYKCRNRNPWYSVPDVRVPAYFLTYMSGVAPNLVRNSAAATCTNALHAVHPRNGSDPDRLIDDWNSTFVQLGCELEGHALGGGMLKLEPREAARVVMPSARTLSELPDANLRCAVRTLRSWRHNDRVH